MKAIELKNVKLSFGGVLAVDDVSFSVAKNEVFSLVGPNGAGKTSVFNAISRFYKLDSGNIYLEGKSIKLAKRHDLVGFGLARTFQNIELFDQSSVLENLLVACHNQKQTSFISELIFFPKVKRQEVAFREIAESIIDLLGIQKYREKAPADLPYGIRKIVELARALCSRPKVLLLDEPGSGLSNEERQDLVFWIRDINKLLGITILLIEHDLSIVRQVSDRVAVLLNGKIIWTGQPKDLDGNERVVEAFIGR